jgi:hypothetical protein
MAERERGEACRNAWLNPSAGTLPWLRELHGSHASLPAPSAFASIGLTPAQLATVKLSSIRLVRHSDT